MRVKRPHQIITGGRVMAEDKRVRQPDWFLTEKHSRDADDPRIERIWQFARNINEHLDLNDKEKYEAEFFADRLLDKLESALIFYQFIKNDSFDTKNISEKRTIYESLYSNLWGFYKGRVQNFLKETGWNLAIFFCKEEDFEKESIKFLTKNPGREDLVEFAKKQRDAWQTDFANSRNTTEHSGDFRACINTYETKGDAQRLFAQVCWTAESLLATCGSYKLAKEWNVIEINSKSNIFMDEPRYIIEHAYETAQREKDGSSK